MTECFSCANNALDDPPPREDVVAGGAWRVAHSFDSALPGWLVLIPRRHVTALDELEADELMPLGALLARLSTALRTVTGCTKTYVMLFAEAEGFEHLHVHLVPRMPDFTDEQKGPGVFWFLTRPEAERLSDAERDDVASRMRAALDA
jgi:diadenosine tetraphosphate (Ap4A) HIT family hydrolase